MPRASNAQNTTFARRATDKRNQPWFNRRASDRFHWVAHEFDDDQLNVGPFCLDLRQKALLMNGINRNLTRKEYELFIIFLVRAGDVVSPRELAIALWPFGNGADQVDVKQYIYLLRRKIESNPRKPRWIRTVRGFGYQLVVEPRERQNTAPPQRNKRTGTRSAARA
ncbi:MAG: winged helix-turn-helix domain-containing protein [Gammaproteobacteria bacterium]|nr:winged helix-turn-helix domain-containing protein [Gammaproteobacteria bacterium]MDH3468774.1 winged helix-turn-helix domain-containing protein [Gammaproteobacteria bacterium]